MTKKIAVILVGRHTNSKFTYRRIMDEFNALSKYGIEVDFFGHYWTDDFRKFQDAKIIDLRNELGADSHKKLYEYYESRLWSKGSNPHPLITHNRIPIVNHYSDSYKSVLTELYKVIYGPGIHITIDPTLYIAYVAQALTISRGFQAYSDYCNTHGVEYDAVFKWRWDLLPEFQPSIEPFLRQGILTDTVHWNDYRVPTGPCDYHFCVNHSTSQTIVKHFFPAMLQIMNDYISTGNMPEEGLWFEKILDTVMQSMGLSNGVTKGMASAIYRRGADPNAKLPDLTKWEREHWHDYGNGWEHRNRL
jgi:hypothetical protein